MEKIRRKLSAKFKELSNIPYIPLFSETIVYINARITIVKVFRLIIAYRFANTIYNSTSIKKDYDMTINVIRNALLLPETKNIEDAILDYIIDLTEKIDIRTGRIGFRSELDDNINLLIDIKNKEPELSLLNKLLDMEI